VDVLKEELQKSRELQDGVKQLQGDVDKLQDSEAMKRAKDMYERARVSVYLILLWILSLFSFSCTRVLAVLLMCAAGNLVDLIYP
jgi:hypothetical protein